MGSIQPLEHPMLDLAYIAITIGFFAACAVSVRLIERL